MESKIMLVRLIIKRSLRWKFGFSDFHCSTPLAKISWENLKIFEYGHLNNTEVTFQIVTNILISYWGKIVAGHIPIKYK